MDKETFDLHCQRIYEKFQTEVQQTSYKNIACDVSDEFIIRLSKTPKRFLSLRSLAVNIKEHDLIYKKIYRLREQLAPRALSLVYNYSLRSASNFFEKEYARLFPEQYPEIPGKPAGYEFMWYSLPKPGKLPAGLVDAIKNDSIEAFEICRQMSNKRICGSLLGLVYKMKAKNILGYLSCGALKQSPYIGGSLDCLLAAITCNYPSDIAAAMLEGLENYNPGCIKSFRDQFGRNLLWYTLYNRLTISRYHPDETVNFLLKQGCDPTEKNVLNLTFLQCSSEEVTQKYRESFKAELSQYIKEENQ